MEDVIDDEKDVPVDAVPDDSEDSTDTIGKAEENTPGTIDDVENKPELPISLPAAAGLFALLYFTSIMEFLAGFIGVIIDPGMKFLLAGLLALGGGALVYYFSP